MEGDDDDWKNPKDKKKGFSFVPKSSSDESDKEAFPQINRSSERDKKSKGIGHDDAYPNFNPCPSLGRSPIKGAHPSGEDIIDEKKKSAEDKKKKPSFKRPFGAKYDPFNPRKNDSDYSEPDPDNYQPSGQNKDEF